MSMLMREALPHVDLAVADTCYLSTKTVLAAWIDGVSGWHVSLEPADLHTNNTVEPVYTCGISL
jgi:hypothetical protein